MKKRLAIKEENNIDEIIERLQMLGGWPVSSSTITTTTAIRIVTSAVLSVRLITPTSTSAIRSAASAAS